MDIAGAKALKRRLGGSEAAEQPRASVELPEDALPVYRWVSAGRAAPGSPPAGADDPQPTRVGSLIRRLGLGLR